MPKVSIIVPNYNHSKYLKQRLDSVFNQTYQDFEVILFDDCSTDSSIEVLQEYSQNPKVSHYIVNTKNSGSTFKQWNKGFALAQGEYIWIAESDDWADVTFLEKLVPILDVNKNVGIALTQSYKTDIKSHIIEKIDYGYLDYSFADDIAIVLGNTFIVEKMLEQNGIPNASAVLFRKKLLVEVGGANEKQRLFSDWLQWIRFLAISDIAICNLYLNYFREHQSTVRKSIAYDVYFKEYFDFLKKLFSINKKRLKYKIPKDFFNVQLREILQKNIEFGGTTWIQRIRKSFFIVRNSFTISNTILCIGMIINSSRYDFYFDENPMKRIKEYFQRKIKF